MKEHPEQREDEVFYANMYPSQFENLVYKTKRMGKNPLPIFNENFQNFPRKEKPLPVFVKKQEFDEKILQQKNCQESNEQSIAKKICILLTKPITRQ